MSNFKARLAKLEQASPEPFVDEEIVFSSDPIKAANQYFEFIRRPYKMPKIAPTNTPITKEQAALTYHRIMG